jgi:hypothetical protein
LGYSTRANRKTRGGTDHPDRNAQSAFIDAAAQEFLVHGWPVISVDTKKQELEGPSKNGVGRLVPRRRASVPMPLRAVA